MIAIQNEINSQQNEIAYILPTGLTKAIKLHKPYCDKVLSYATYAKVQILLGNNLEAYTLSAPTIPLLRILH